jgi:hypothetical protein
MPSSLTAFDDDINNIPDVFTRQPRATAPQQPIGPAAAPAGHPGFAGGFQGVRNMFAPGGG